jgi:hypothetical protein
MNGGGVEIYQNSQDWKTIPVNANNTMLIRIIFFVLVPFNHVDL